MPNLNEKYIETRELMNKLKGNVLIEVTPELEDTIAEMPAADVELIVHGTWEYADWPLKSSNRFCSVCGRAEKIYAYNRDDFKYCRCGAKMDRGSE